MPKVMVLGGRAFGRWLDMRMSPHEWDWCPCRRDVGELSHASCLGRTQREGGNLWPRARRPSRHGTSWCLLLRFPAPELCEISACCLNHQYVLVLVAARTKIALVTEEECFTYCLFVADHLPFPLPGFSGTEDPGMALTCSTCRCGQVLLVCRSDFLQSQGLAACFWWALSTGVTQRLKGQPQTSHPKFRTWDLGTDIPCLRSTDVTMETTPWALPKSTSNVGLGIRWPKARVGTSEKRWLLLSTAVERREHGAFFLLLRTSNLCHSPKVTQSMSGSDPAHSSSLPFPLTSSKEKEGVKWIEWLHFQWKWDDGGAEERRERYPQEKGIRSWSFRGDQIFRVAFQLFTFDLLGMWYVIIGEGILYINHAINALFCYSLQPILQLHASCKSHYQKVKMETPGEVTACASPGAVWGKPAFSSGFWGSDFLSSHAGAHRALPTCSALPLGFAQRQILNAPGESSFCEMFYNVSGSLYRTFNPKPGFEPGRHTIP